MDPRDDNSYQDGFMALKVFAFSGVFFGCAYMVHRKM